MSNKYLMAYANHYSFLNQTFMNWYWQKSIHRRSVRCRGDLLFHYRFNTEFEPGFKYRNTSCRRRIKNHRRVRGLLRPKTASVSTWLCIRNIRSLRLTRGELIVKPVEPGLAAVDQRRSPHIGRFYRFYTRHTIHAGAKLQKAVRNFMTDAVYLCVGFGFFGLCCLFVRATSKLLEQSQWSRCIGSWDHWLRPCLFISSSLCSNQKSSLKS